jgi:hypothetical protein
MKMLKNLQIDFDSGSPETIRGTTILVRLAGGCIDLSWLDPDQERERYAQLRGLGLNVLLPRILTERQIFFRAGMECPRGCELQSVVRRNHMDPDPEDMWCPPERNRVPPWIFCADTGNARWYLDYLSLQKFGPSRLKGHREVLLQFASRIAVVVHSDEGSDLWAQFRTSNLEVGTLNKLSTWSDYAYLGAGLGAARYRAEEIVVERKNRAADGEWNLNVGGAPGDKRPDKSPGKSPAPAQDEGGMEL